jgi:hypothetical protein
LRPTFDPEEICRTAGGKSLLQSANPQLTEISRPNAYKAPGAAIFDQARVLLRAVFGFHIKPLPTG